MAIYYGGYSVTNYSYEQTSYYAYYENTDYGYETINSYTVYPMGSNYANTEITPSYYGHDSKYTGESGRQSSYAMADYSGSNYGAASHDSYSHEFHSYTSYSGSKGGVNFYKTSYFYAPPGNNEYRTLGDIEAFNTYYKSSYYGENRSSAGYEVQESGGVYFHSSFYGGPDGPNYYSSSYVKGGTFGFGY